MWVTLSVPDPQLNLPAERPSLGLRVFPSLSYLLLTQSDTYSGKTAVCAYLVLHIVYLEIVAVGVVGVPEKGCWRYTRIFAALFDLLALPGNIVCATSMNATNAGMTSRRARICIALLYGNATITYCRDGWSLPSELVDCAVVVL